MTRHLVSPSVLLALVDPLLPMALLALAGWGVAAAAIYELLRGRRRLEAVARAEHELRGPATVLLLACERMRREPTGRRHARALEVELERMAGGLAGLTAARTGRRHRAGRARAMRASVSWVRWWAAHSAVAPLTLRAGGRPARLDWRAGRVGLPE